MRLVRGWLVISLGLWLPCAARAHAYVPGTGINGTAHDLSTRSGMNYAAIPPDPLDRICVYCHAPHNAYGTGRAVGGGPQAPDAFDYMPLWNHEITRNHAAFAMYQNGSAAPPTGARAPQAVAIGMTLGSNSLLCLSCHDGSVAVNSYGMGAQGGSRSGGGSMINRQYAIGQDSFLGNHHPVGFDYDAVQAEDGDIRPAEVALMGTAGTVRDHLYGAGNTTMECGTCHAIHNTGNTGEALLWRSDRNSRLCLTCHDLGMNPMGTP